MNGTKKNRFIRLVIFFAFFFSSAALWAKPDVGWIESINGNPTAVQIMRDGKALAAIQFLPIQAGDRITIRDDVTTVDVTYGHGGTLQVAPQKPVTVSKQDRAVPNVASNLMNWLVSTATMERKKPGVVSATSRELGGDENLSMPLLANNSTVISGARSLALAWLGGKAPYQLEILRRDTRSSVVQVKNIPGRNFVIRVDLPVGTYELLLIDSNGVTWREKLAAKPEDRLPSSPKELTQLPEQLQKILVASWLATIENGQWAVEAYSRVVELERLNVPGSVSLKAALEAGNMPGRND